MTFPLSFCCQVESGHWECVTRVNWVWSVCGCLWPGGALCAVCGLSKRTCSLRRAAALPISILPSHRAPQQMGPSSCCRYREHVCVNWLVNRIFLWEFDKLLCTFCWQLPTATQNVCGCCSVARGEPTLLMLQMQRDSMYELLALLLYLLMLFIICSCSQHSFK